MEGFNGEREFDITNAYRFPRNISSWIPESSTNCSTENVACNPKRVKMGDLPPNEERNKEETFQQPLLELPSTSSFVGNGYNPSDYFCAESDIMTPYNMCGTVNQTKTHDTWGTFEMTKVSDKQKTLSKVSLNHSLSDTPVFSTGMGATVSSVVKGETPIFTKKPRLTRFSPLWTAKERKDPTQGTIKRISKCVLYPPPIGDQSKPRCERPLGCKTIFVSGLPEKITEAFIREVFKNSGEITDVRITRKSFCHIKFASELSVDRALCLSGYCLKIGDKDEASYFGKLHVDYAIACEDQFEYESRMRTLQRESHHSRERVVRCVPNFPELTAEAINFSELAATALVESLREEETFKKGIQILINWLEHGMCNKGNAVSFFSMMQSLNSFVSRLMNDTAKVEEEVRQNKCRLNGKYAANALQFNDIEKVFNIASMQKVWDHFTKAQRKRIELWKKHMKEIKESNSRDLLSDRVEAEMNMSDEENDGATTKEEHQNVELQRLLEENKLLRSELDQHKVKLVRDKEELKVITPGLKSIVTNQHCENYSISSDKISSSSSGTCSGIVCITESQARLIGLIGAFLNFHRFGETIDCICKYLSTIDSTIDPTNIENLMKKFPTVFREELLAAGDSHERKWTFLSF